VRRTVTEYRMDALYTAGRGPPKPTARTTPDATAKRKEKADAIHPMRYPSWPQRCATQGGSPLLRRPFMSSSPVPADQAARAKRRILVATSLVTSLIMLDSNIVAVSLPSITRTLGAGFADIEWVISAY